MPILTLGVSDHDAAVIHAGALLLFLTQTPGLNTFWSRITHMARFGTRPNRSANFHQGIGYDAFLKQIHDVLEPSTYLEIGVGTGATLDLAHCTSVAIDSQFQLGINKAGSRAETYYFQMQSDEFFAKHDLRKFLPGGVDFVFLDGMHLYEYLLRDFINTEKYAHKKTIVAMHDCYPINLEVADREMNLDRRTDDTTRLWWSGDVWKLLPILRDYRPDLQVTVFDCPPTGLVIVKGLDSDAKALTNNHDEILAKYQNITLAEFGLNRFNTEFPTSDSRRYFEREAMWCFFDQH